MEIPKYLAKLREKKQVTPDTFIFFFEKPKDFTFAAGQFVQFCIPTEGKTVLRSYSISSTPTDPYLEFCIKILEHGLATQYINKLQIGDGLEFLGPRGLFIQKETNQAISCIATGTGLAPILGIIRDELENKKNTSEIRLLFGVRTEEDIFWLERMQELQSKFDNFVYEVTLSQPKPDGGWSGLRGRVTEHILHHLVSHQFFLCGSAPMVKDVRQILLQNGVDAKAIHFEIF